MFCMRQKRKEWCMKKGKGRTKPNVKPWLLDKLSKLFEPYNQKFYNMIGKDFKWGTPDPKKYKGN